MTKHKYYRTRQEFKYAPTGRIYAVGVEDTLSDWHPDDIKVALRNLIEEIDPPEIKTQTEGTSSKVTEESNG